MSSLQTHGLHMCHEAMVTILFKLISSNNARVQNFSNVLGADVSTKAVVTALTFLDSLRSC